jgi:membrane associated rhomboid family serine protease
MSTLPPDDRPPAGDLTPQDDRMPADFDTAMPDDLEVRYCYRHGDRETGVSCSSCGRPICHECMIPAPVGFRCPECVRAQNAGGGRAKVVTRGQIRSRWGSGGLVSRATPVTRALVAINVAVFVLEMVLATGMLLGGGVSSSTLVSLGALVPARVALENEYWRLFTSMFLHANLFHIAFNMWALWVVGSVLERIMGSLRFVLLYLVSGLAGSVLVLVAGPAWVPTVGASGAIFGVFGALFAWAFLSRGRDFVADQLVRQVGIILVLNLVITFGFSSSISWQAHIGGLLGGFAAFAALRYGDKQGFRGPLSTDALVALGGVVAVLFALVVWRVQTF